MALIIIVNTDLLPDSVFCTLGIPECIALTPFVQSGIVKDFGAMHSPMPSTKNAIGQKVYSRFFVLPFLFVVIFNSFDYVASSYNVGESSNSPLGLPYRWAIKAVIPLSFTLLAMAVLSRLFRNFNILKNSKKV